MNDGWQTMEGTTPKKVFVVSAESGLLCVQDLLTQGLIDGGTIDEPDDINKVKTYCLSNEFKSAGYEWIFIDSLTEIGSIYEKQAKRNHPDGRDAFKMWGDYSDKITEMIKAFRDMSNYNVIMTCLEVPESIGEGKNTITRIAPDIAGSKIKNRLTSYFDEVFHMEKIVNNNGKDVVVFSTQRPVGLAKDRSGKLNAIEEPNLLKIQQKILGR